MKIVRVKLEAFCIAVDEVDGNTRGSALQPLLRQHGFEPNGVWVREVPDSELRFMPARALRLLKDATKAEHGPAASIAEMRALHQALLAASDGLIAVVEDEIASMDRVFGYPPRKWVLERTRRALERATAPAAPASGRAA